MMRFAVLPAAILCCWHQGAVLGQGAAGVEAGAGRERQELDIVHLTDGDPIAGIIVMLTDELCRIEQRREVGSSRFDIPLSRVRYIDFREDPELERLLRAPDLVEHGQALAEAWSSRLLRLGLPNHPAGRVGLVYADLLREQGAHNVALLERALRIYGMVEGQDWDEARRAVAKQGRLQVMLLLGDTEGVVREARRMAEVEEDPALLIQARRVLADIDFERLRRLEDEHPRWDLDDEIRPERQDLFHRVIDAYLNPYLFFGTYEEEAAEGLAMAAEVYEFGGEIEEAVARREDLLALYPRTAAAVRVGEAMRGGQDQVVPDERDERGEGVGDNCDKPETPNDDTEEQDEEA